MAEPKPAPTPASMDSSTAATPASSDASTLPKQTKKTSDMPTAAAPKPVPSSVPKPATARGTSASTGKSKKTSETSKKVKGKLTDSAVAITNPSILSKLPQDIHFKTFDHKFSDKVKRAG